MKEYSIGSHKPIPNFQNRNNAKIQSQPHIQSFSNAINNDKNNQSQIIYESTQSDH